MAHFRSMTAVQELALLGGAADAFEIGEPFFENESPTEAPCCIDCATHDAPAEGSMSADMAGGPVTIQATASSCGCG